MRGRILAIGAYDRDNFGDYLFYYVLNAVARDKFDIIPGALSSRDMRSPYGIITQSYDKSLSNNSYDAVWVVGGEVGGVDIHSAICMLNTGRVRDMYVSSLKNSSIRILLDYIEGVSAINTKIAYIPNLSQYELNKDAKLIINSVGLSKADLSKISVRSLMENASITVRDKSSYEVCKKARVKSSLVPDVVHSIAKVYTPSKKNGKYILAQLNHGYIVNQGYNNVLNRLRELHEATGLNVRFIAAGTAEGHDSLDLYNDMVNSLGEWASVITSRKATTIVDYIANAEIVVATSLHFRIISMTYGARIVSLKNDKVTQYVNTWKDKSPCDVDISCMSKCVADELAKDAPSPRMDLIESAYDNLIDKINSIEINDHKGDIIYEPLSSIQSRDKARESVDKLVFGYENKVQIVENELDHIKKQLSDVQYQYDSLIEHIKQRRKKYAIIYFIYDSLNKIRKRK